MRSSTAIYFYRTLFVLVAVFVGTAAAGTPTAAASGACRLPGASILSPRSTGLRPASGFSAFRSGAGFLRVLRRLPVLEL